MTPGGPGRMALGRRVQTLERTWLTTPDPAARSRAVGIVADSVARWFRLDITGVARGLVEAEALLRDENGPSLDDLWAGATMVSPARRVLAPGEAAAFRIAGAFAVESVPPDARIAIEILVGEGPIGRTLEPPFPVAVAIPLPDDAVGDLVVTIRLEAGGTERRRIPERVSVIEDGESRISALDERLTGLPRSLERETAAGIVARVRAAAGGFPIELPLAAAAELTRAERLATHAGAGTSDPALAAPGDRWVRLPTGLLGTPCRIFVPAEAASEPRPLVVAIHGLGGSEELFFEAHGVGLGPRLAEERGWLFAAPGLSIPGAGPDLGTIVDELAAFLPVDPDRIFLVGHSLGAVRIARALSREPDRYRAVAPLSGGGPLSGSPDLTGLPCFLAAGDQDFGMGMTLVLENALETAGADVTRRTYAPSEHLLMVADALPDVFSFFEAHLGRSDED